VVAFFSEYRHAGPSQHQPTSLVCKKLDRHTIPPRVSMCPAARRTDNADQIRQRCTHFQISPNHHSDPPTSPSGSRAGTFAARENTTDEGGIFPGEAIVTIVLVERCRADVFGYCVCDGLMK
jgi:hypothetical protein